MIKKLVLKQPEPPAKEVPVEVIADAIVAISAGVKALRQTRLNDKALYMLIAHAAPGYGGQYSAKKHVSAVQVRVVLQAMEQLEREYLKPRKP